MLKENENLATAVKHLTAENRRLTSEVETQMSSSGDIRSRVSLLEAALEKVSVLSLFLQITARCFTLALDVNLVRC